MKKFIKKNTGEIIILIGTGMFVYNIFSWDYNCRGVIARFCEQRYLEYDDETKMFLTIGIVLLVLGIFVIKKKTERLS